MTSIWLPAALFAGLFQAWRTAIQQRLRSEVSVSGAGFVRYFFGLPFAALMCGVWFFVREAPLPTLSPALGAYAAAAGLFQMAGTLLLIMSFGHRGYVAGTAFSKTEAIQAAVVAAILLGERLPALAWAGIALGVAGVLILALAGRGLSAIEIGKALRQPAALYGLGAGGLFALAGIMVRLATDELPAFDAVGAALVTLVIVMTIQTSIHLMWIVARDQPTLWAVHRSWRVSAQVGLLSALGSACWFTGFATAPVALVRIVGQVEVLFTLGFGRLYLREATRPHEIIGLLLIAGGVVLALAATI